MKKRIVKLDKQQLRSLITEAIMSRSPGDPLWSPPREKKRAVKEVVVDQPLHTAPPSVASERLQPTLDALSDTLSDVWTSLYDEGDPVQSEHGLAEWETQVDIAVDEVVSTLMDTIDDVEQNLHNGEYYGK